MNTRGSLPNIGASHANWSFREAPSHRRKPATQEQANIEAHLLNLYLADNGTTAIAEWEATFDDLVQGHRKRMREVAILEFDGDQIASLREYWASEQIPSTVAPANP